MSKAKPVFRQVDAHKYSKLGVRRKKKVKYRFPNGRDNKIRLNYAGRVRKVKVGFKNENAGRHLVGDKVVVRIENVNDLNKIEKGMIGILGKVGSKNKKAIAEKVVKANAGKASKDASGHIELYRFDAAKFLKDLETKMKENKDKKNKRKADKISRDKKAKEAEEKAKKDADKKEKAKADKKESLEKKTEEKEVSKDEKKVKESKIKEKKK